MTDQLGFERVYDWAIEWESRVLVATAQAYARQACLGATSVCVTAANSKSSTNGGRLRGGRVSRIAGATDGGDGGCHKSEKGLERQDGGTKAAYKGG
jgi:hypothetical protein